MTLLRRISTRQLLALTAVVVVAVAGTAAIAIAATSGGPVPPPKPLATAIHDALGAPRVEAVSARVEYTNHLVGESVTQGADPFLTGASGRLWISGRRLRLELQSEGNGGGSGDAQALLDGNRFTVYDPGTETVYRGTLPAGASRATPDSGAKSDHPGVPSLGTVQAKLSAAMKYVTLSGALPSDVAGQAAYTVRVEPKEDGGLVGAVEVAWDAENGAPLRAAVYARGESTPVLELTATEISFGPVSSSVFEVTPPPGAKVVDVSPPRGGGAGGQGQPPLSGLDPVQRRVGFTISAPATLAGMGRDGVRLVGHGPDAGALLTYGRGLGGLAVVELPAGGGQHQHGAGPGGGETGGLQLPSVTISGVTKGQELTTPLGTLIRFERDGVEYTVAGSVTAAVALEGAQGL